MALLVNGGQHCAKTDCNQYDFLPFTCEACKKVYCLEHRSQNDHDCTGARPENKNNVPQCPVCKKYIFIQNNESVDIKMSKHIDSGCKDFIVNLNQKPKSACAYTKCDNNRAPVKCPKCTKYYCAQHRLPDDHECPVESPKKGGLFWNPFKDNLNNNNNNDKNDKNDKNKKNSKKKKNKFDPSKNRIRLKQEAVGNANIESDNRFYLEITFSKDIKKKSLIMFFNKKKTVGRILDEICEKRNIKNKNHLPNARKLVVDCVRTESQLPFDMPLHLMEPQFISGDQVFIRYEDEESQNQN